MLLWKKYISLWMQIKIQSTWNQSIVYSLPFKFYHWTQRMSVMDYSVTLYSRKVSVIGWDIIDFSSESAEQNLTKIDRKQDINVFWQGCVFRGDRRKRWQTDLSLAEIFETSPLKPLNRIQRNLTGSKISTRPCPGFEPESRPLNFRNLVSFVSSRWTTEILLKRRILS